MRVSGSGPSGRTACPSVNASPVLTPEATVGVSDGASYDAIFCPCVPMRVGTEGIWRGDPLPSGLLRGRRDTGHSPTWGSRCRSRSPGRRPDGPAAVSFVLGNRPPRECGRAGAGTGTSPSAVWCPLRRHGGHICDPGPGIFLAPRARSDTQRLSDRWPPRPCPRPAGLPQLRALPSRSPAPSPGSWGKGRGRGWPSSHRRVCPGPRCSSHSGPGGPEFAPSLVSSFSSSPGLFSSCRNALGNCHRETDALAAPRRRRRFPCSLGELLLRELSAPAHPPTPAGAWTDLPLPSAPTAAPPPETPTAGSLPDLAWASPASS